MSTKPPTGSIRARPGGKWQVRVAGKSRNVDSRRAAERMRRSMLEEHERATQSVRVETTVGSFQETWLADCADRLAPRTVHSYQRISRLQAFAPLLPLELHEVTARHLAPVISRVTAEHGRPSGLAAFRSLSAMFGLAERWGYIEMNPFRRMQAPTVPKPGSTVLVGADRAVDTQKVPSCMGE